MKRARIVIIILYTSMGILLLVKIYLTAQFSELDERYAALTTAQNEQKRQHAILEEQLLRYTSYDYIKQEAEKQGFIEATHFYP